VIDFGGSYLKIEKFANSVFCFSLSYVIISLLPFFPWIASYCLMCREVLVGTLPCCSLYSVIADLLGRPVSAGRRSISMTLCRSLSLSLPTTTTCNYVCTACGLWKMSEESHPFIFFICNLYNRITMGSKSLFKKPKNPKRGQHVTTTATRAHHRRTTANDDSSENNDEDETTNVNDNQTIDAEEENHSGKIASSDEIHEEDEGDTSTAARIMATKRKRVIKRQLNQVKQGAIVVSSSEIVTPIEFLGKKRRLQTKRSNTIANADDAEDDAVHQQSSNKGAKSLQEGLRGTFSNAKLGARSSNIDGGSIDDDDAELFGEGVLGQKHKAAMQDFVQSQLNNDIGGGNVNDEVKEKMKNASHGKGVLSRDAKHKLEEEALYREVAASVITRGEDAAGNVVSGEVDNVVDPNKTEGDVGSGGTMLGGTGIAEVILPVEDRIGTVRATQEAVVNRIRKRRQGQNQQQNIASTFRSDAAPFPIAQQAVLPMSFASGPAKSRRPPTSLSTSQQPGGGIDFSTAATREAASSFSASSAGTDILKSDVEAVSASYAHNFQLHKHEWASRREEERVEEEEQLRVQAQHAQGPIGNKDRIGFAAARGKADLEKSTDGGAERQRAAQGQQQQQQGRGGGQQRRPNDDAMWRNFVKFQRERGGKRR
jgi:hypothetical protein